MELYKGCAELFFRVPGLVSDPKYIPGVKLPAVDCNDVWELIDIAPEYFILRKVPGTNENKKLARENATYFWERWDQRNNKKGD